MHLNYPLQVLDCLRAGKEKLLIGWTQEVCARDASGVPVAESENPAACWCLFGAVYVTDDDLRTETMHFLNSIVDGGNAIRWQDEPGRTREEVIGLVDRAIEFCEAQCLAG